MRNISAAILAGIMALVSFGGLAAAKGRNDISGEWQGLYLSNAGGDANTFTLTFSGSPASLSGTVVEVNVFGDRNLALFLTSDIKGEQNGSNIYFEKTYDGSGGVSHSVQYQGMLSGDGRHISGTYYLNGTAAGVFELAR